MREIVLDTETTGMDPRDGDRLVEIGCVELMNHVPTGRTYHQYINPERDVPAGAVAVHGLTEAFLKDKPVFAEIYTEFLDFIGDDGKLVIHNAEFDVKFLNAELANVGFPGFRLKDTIDTLKIARERFPGSPANLDALCRRFGVDNTGRELHGALLDAQLLGEVYLELCGGRQHGLILNGDTATQTPKERGSVLAGLGDVRRQNREKRDFPVHADERAAHEKLVESLTDAIWKRAD